MLTPDRVCCPADSTTPPAPPITPENIPEAFVSVRSLSAAVRTSPLPDRVWIDAPCVVPVMSNVPSAVTPLDEATLPLSESARVAPPAMRVAPV